MEYVVKILTHYPVDDPDCTGDYCSVDVLVDGELVRQYGDWYHDKGDVQARAFVEGFLARPHIQADVEYDQVADYEV